MRPHGRARISSKYPQALGVCDRCGFLYNHIDLEWQYDWKMGPRLFNQGILVCPTCLDKPQPSGRPIVLPPDPVAVEYARPEAYALADNPLSPLGYNVAASFLPQPLQSLGANIGNMTLNAGVNAAFDGVTNKRAQYSAALVVSNSSFQNTVGKNWNTDPSGTTLTLPSTTGTIQHIVSSFSIYAPNDAPFLNAGATGFHLDGSNNNATWTTIYSGTTVGTIGETITVTTTGTTPFAYHRLALQGDGFSAAVIAQLVLNVADAAPNDI